jgi:hypothetical protein
VIVWNLIGAPRAGVVLQAGSRWVQDGPCLLGAQDGGGWWFLNLAVSALEVDTSVARSKSQSTRSGTPHGSPTGHSQSPRHQSTRVHCCACLPAGPNDGPLHHLHSAIQLQLWSSRTQRGSSTLSASPLRQVSSTHTRHTHTHTQTHTHTTHARAHTAHTQHTHARTRAQDTTLIIKFSAVQWSRSCPNRLGFRTATSTALLPNTPV